MAELISTSGPESSANLEMRRSKATQCLSSEVQDWLLPPEPPISEARVLPLLHEWKMVYADNNSEIFVRTAPL